MSETAKIKPKDYEITTENVRFICGLNGLTVTELAAKLGCSDTMVYLATREPERYPNFYPRICALLPRRTV